MQSSWAEDHSRALREYLEKGLSFFADRKGDQRQVQYRLFPQCHDRPRQADGAFRSRAGRYSRPAETAAEAESGAAAQDARTRPCPIPAQAGGAETGRGAETSLRRHRAAPPVAARARTRRLPLPLWRRGGGRGHHLLRPPAPRGFELLRRAFSPDQLPRPHVGTHRRQGAAAAGGGGMSAKVTVMAMRIKRLSPRHRLAHLRALIRREPAGSNRRAGACGAVARTTGGAARKRQPQPVRRVP